MRTDLTLNAVPGRTTFIYRIVIKFTILVSNLLALRLTNIAKKTAQLIYHRWLVFFW